MRSTTQLFAELASPSTAKSHHHFDDYSIRRCADKTMASTKALGGTAVRLCALSILAAVAANAALLTAEACWANRNHEGSTAASAAGGIPEAAFLDRSSLANMIASDDGRYSDSVSGMLRSDFIRPIALSQRTPLRLLEEKSSSSYNDYWQATLDKEEAQPLADGLNLSTPKFERSSQMQSEEDMRAQKDEKMSSSEDQDVEPMFNDSANLQDIIRSLLGGNVS